MIKKIVIGFVLVLALLAAAIFLALLPAHQQVRGIEVEFPEAPIIEELFFSGNHGPESFPIDLSYINTATQGGPFGTLGHVGILMTWSDGRQFLIDSGMSAKDAQEFGSRLEIFGAGPTETFGAIEEQLGDSVTNIKGMAFTHLHSDHTIGLTAICEATNGETIIYQTEKQSSQQNLHTAAGQELVNQSKCEAKVLGNEVVKPVPGFPGLFAISAAGHTPGSTIFVTYVYDQYWIFAGDLTNAMANVYNNEGKGWMYSNVLVPEDEKTLEKWRVWLKEQDDRDNVTVLVAHDILAYEKSSLNTWQVAQELNAPAAATEPEQEQQAEQVPESDEEGQAAEE